MYQISRQSVYILRFIKKQKCQPHSGAREKSGITNVSRLPPLGTMNVCAEFHGNSSEEQTDIAIPRTRSIALLKIKH